MKVVSYIRVSTAKQEDKDGPVRQREAIKAFCDKNILEHDGEYSESISGTIDGLDRPEFSKMIQAIEANNNTHAQLVHEGSAQGSTPIVGFVVESMNRLARTLMVSEYILLLCKEKGIKVFTCENGTLQDAADDSGDPSRVLVRQIMGAVAEFMKSELVKKMAKARARVRAETGRCEGGKPYGYYDGEKTIIDTMFRLETLGWKHARIARALNEEGHRNRAAKPWTKGNVWAIMNKAKKRL